MKKLIICIAGLALCYVFSYAILSAFGDYQMSATGHGMVYSVWVPYGHRPGELFSGKMFTTYAILSDIDRRHFHKGKSEVMPKSFLK